ncbi:hypothetical protein PoB_004383600 [Plakobranchus ocellatus]|uniref:Uncharacterized protein n=1 Tax=Plakobranchus ocellatus TaxID=259542 RepID=A0AAV4BA91_9GAST|nr:hypothetical protein PoB_004383600 [Plakobranchus ocellatus]
MLNYYYYAEGRGRRLLAYHSCSSPNQGPLQRSLINKQKARGTSWVVVKESTVLSYSSDKKAGHALTLVPSLPHCPCPNPRYVITFRLVFHCTVSGNPLESGDVIFQHSFCEKNLENKLELRDGDLNPHQGLCPWNLLGANLARRPSASWGYVQPMFSVTCHCWS